MHLRSALVPMTLCCLGAKLRAVKGREAATRGRQTPEPGGEAGSRSPQTDEDTTPWDACQYMAAHPPDSTLGSLNFIKTSEVESFLEQSTSRHCWKATLLMNQNNTHRRKVYRKTMVQIGRVTLHVCSWVHQLQQFTLFCVKGSK